jgi:hypothetical protein
MGFSSKPNVNGLAMKLSFPVWTGCESPRHLLQSEQLASAIAFVASSAKRASAQRLSIAVSLRLISDLGDR